MSFCGILLATLRLPYKVSQLVTAERWVMAIQTFVGRVGLARLLGLTEQWVRQLDPVPDALIDGRPAWLMQTAARLKAERDVSRAQRKARRSKRARAQQAGEASA